MRISSVGALTRRRITVAAFGFIDLTVKDN